MRFFNYFHKKAFTLVELLLAITIVAVVAALVVPSVVNKYQNKVMQNSYNRYMTTLMEMVERLPIIEGVSSFDKTSLYADVDSLPYLTASILEKTSEKFLRNNFKIIKYCGNTYQQNLYDSFPDCFPENYILNEKRANGTYESDKIYPQVVIGDKEHPEAEGNVWDLMTYSCAVIKGGATLCIRPQLKFKQEYEDAGLGQLQNVTGWIDVNGKKGPNAIGIDMWRFTFPYQDVSNANKMDSVDSISTSDVKDYLYECDNYSTYQPLCCRGWFDNSGIWNEISLGIKKQCCGYLYGDGSMPFLSKCAL